MSVEYAADGKRTEDPFPRRWYNRGTLGVDLRSTGDLSAWIFANMRADVREGLASPLSFVPGGLEWERRRARVQAENRARLDDLEALKEPGSTLDQPARTVCMGCGCGAGPNELSYRLLCGSCAFGSHVPGICNKCGVAVHPARYRCDACMMAHARGEFGPAYITTYAAKAGRKSGGAVLAKHRATKRDPWTGSK